MSHPEMQLGDRLLASFVDDEVEQAWVTEVERRVEEIEAGRTRLVPVSEAIARARAAVR